MTNFAFLRPEWQQVYESAAKAEALVHPDPRTSCFYARRALELLLQWLYKADAKLKLPYQDNLSALIYEPSFLAVAGAAIQNKARLIKEHGNRAVHTGRPIQQYDALIACRELFHICYWLARNYARAQRPADGIVFNPDLLPKTSPVPAQTLNQIQNMEEQVRLKDESIADLLAKVAVYESKLASMGPGFGVVGTGPRASDLIAGPLGLAVGAFKKVAVQMDPEYRDAAQISRLRADVAAAKQANEKTPDTHDYSEAETRDAFIDLLLKESGWPLKEVRDREYQVTGMPNNEGIGFVDYVLWGDDGRPLGLVEAKRTKRDAEEGQEQARLYADCLEKQFGQRPVIFYSNGYEHWIWDDIQYPPRLVQGFYSKDELKLLIERRATKHALASVAIDPAIVERYYQERAIRRVTESFAQQHRKALLVMATGSGKTRTVIALCDVLMRANWAKRVLFLADRNALVRQAVNAFKRHLPAASPVNVVTERDQDGRVYVCTYQTMMGLIDEMKDGARRFGPGYFDLVVVDEAHRSIYKKFGAIFGYFDALLVGLTATPQNEIDRNTYRLFALESGVPTDEYSLDEAVKDGYLVPPRNYSVPLKFQREGIRYDELSEEEKEEWDALEWGEDEEAPDQVNAEAVNRWLFNKDTVDKVLEHLMTHGHKVAGGDRLGKTIVFAKNHAHALFIAERFDANYPHLAGHFARVIDFKVDYAQSLIDNFSQPEKAPHIAISVDMLDTGIDVPEVVNLVFFKLVRSKTKFWQMVGRGTRLRPELYGPGKDKRDFYIFDFCQNLEFFSQDIPLAEGGAGGSLGERLFTARLELIGELHARRNGDESSEAAGRVRTETADLLRQQVAAMPLENFIVRPKRRLVEWYSEASAWEDLSVEQYGELAHEVAPLPTGLADADQDAKHFDLLVLRLQLALLRAEVGFERMRRDVVAIASALEEKAAIPMVREQMALIQEVQSDPFWEGVNVPVLEDVRRKLRGLVKFIEKSRRAVVYTDFEDELGHATTVELPGVSTGVISGKFRDKVLHFLRAHEDDPAIHKVKWNEPLTFADLSALESMLVQAGVGKPEDVEQAARQEHGLGLFIRSLVGLDRQAAKLAFEAFLSGKNLTANQNQFVDLLINHLTQCGWMDARQLFESPFTDMHPHGAGGVFGAEKWGSLLLCSLR